MKVVGQQKVMKINMDYEKKGLDGFLSRAPHARNEYELTKMVIEEDKDAKNPREVENIHDEFVKMKNILDLHNKIIEDSRNSNG